MKKAIMIYVIILIVHAFCGCAFGPGMSDYSYDLTGDYKLIFSKEITYLLGP